MFPKIFKLIIFTLAIQFGLCQEEIKPNISLIEGSYELAENDNDNFENFLQEIGVNLLLRILARVAKPVVIDISLDGEGAEGEWTIKTTSPFRSTDIKFRLGEDFEEKTLDGRKCTSRVTATAHDTLYHVQKCVSEAGDEQPELSQKRVFSDSKFINTFQGPTTKAQRTYLRIKDPQ